MEPAAFAAELISRLEKLKLELESRHSLEERLQQIREVGPAPASSPPCPCIYVHGYMRVPAHMCMNPGCGGVSVLFTSPLGPLFPG